MSNPSSLIFVAIVLVWAGWLLQHQIRRRQVLATVRTVDMFSDAIRVLERRTPVTVSTASAPRTSLRAGSVLHAEPAAPVVVAPTHPAPSSLPASSAKEVAMTADSSWADKLRPVLGASRRVLAERRTRGIAFLVAVALLPLCLLLSAVGAISWLSIVASLMLIGAVVLWLRAAAVAERKQRADRPAARRPVPRLSALPSQSPEVSADTRADVVAPAPVDVPFDAQPAPVAPVAHGATAVPVEDPAPVLVPGTWSPVQVPKPTYTMKAKAPERQTPPAATSQAGPAPRSYADTPVDELPFDGMALDPEAEELPSAFRAG